MGLGTKNASLWTQACGTFGGLLLCHFYFFFLFYKYKWKPNEGFVLKSAPYIVQKMTKNQFSMKTQLNIFWELKDKIMVSKVLCLPQAISLNFEAKKQFFEKAFHTLKTTKSNCIGDVFPAKFSPREKPATLLN